jgi:hypothetical protein
VPTPNINQAGVRVRRVTAILMALAALLCIWPALALSPFCWIAVTACAAVSIFCWYEASRSWCALRACGIKTRV